jgi:hypothetical protein
VRGVTVGEHLGYLFTGLERAGRCCPHPVELAAPLFGIGGLLLAPPFVLGSLEFVGRSSPGGWKPAGTLALASIGWSLWLLALGIGLLVTA